MAPAAARWPKEEGCKQSRPFVIALRFQGPCTRCGRRRSRETALNARSELWLISNGGKAPLPSIHGQENRQGAFESQRQQECRYLGLNPKVQNFFIITDVAI